METTDILFALLRHAVCGEELKETVISACTPEMLESVYTLSKKHDLAHLVAYAVEGLQIPACEVTDKLKKAKMKAIYRYARLEYEFERICGVLEQAEIPFIPLKGSVLRKYYPEPWMRTSCDIDVLVTEENLSSAIKALSQNDWKIKGEVNYHDISLYSALGVHLELHFHIRENMDDLDPTLTKVWECIVPVEGKQYQKQQSLPFFIFHQLAHMVYHFRMGGCGIRPFLDIWFLRKSAPYDDLAVRSLCQEAGIESFYDAILRLIEVWFGKRPHTVETKRIEQFILNGGLFGDASNKMLISKVSANMSAHWFSRIFLPYDLLKVKYPILEKYRVLMPVFQLRRWFGKMNVNRMWKLLRKRKKVNCFEETQNLETIELLKSVGFVPQKMTTKEKK